MHTAAYTIVSQTIARVRDGVMCFLRLVRNEVVGVAFSLALNYIWKEKPYSVNYVI